MTLHHQGNSSLIIMSVTWGDFHPHPAEVWYIALADWIQGQMEAGNLRSGDRLPAQRELGELTGTSTELAGKAIAVLRDRGLVKTSVRGSFVA